MTRFLVLALLALSVLVGGLPTAASAAASSGAFKIYDEHCHEEPHGAVTCFAVHGVGTETMTPSGNISITAHMRTTFTNYDATGTLVSTTTSKSHAVRLLTQGGEDMHVLSERYSSTTTNADGTVCTYTYTMQYVNGQIKFHTVENSCGTN